MHDRKIAVVGLGYVGLPVAVAFGRLGETIGFDIDADRVRELHEGRDRTGECAQAALGEASIRFTGNPAALGEADFYIVTVPTPIDAAKRPDLGSLAAACATLGPVITRGDIVVFESTVYPGATEECCIPWLEVHSGLRAGRDFFVGYSPERINPGDRTHRLETITKVVSAQDPATLDVVARVYGSVVRAGIHRAPAIKVAEAAKVIENTQRDLNIALMNELALIFGRMGVDTRAVLAAAGTKWNFLTFSPGLVGGHCIGVDPYYLTHKAALLDYHPQVILAGRQINDGMGRHIAAEAVKRLMRRGGSLDDLVVTVLGLTFKEDVPDLRNTRVVDIVQELQTFGVRVQAHDPIASPSTVSAELGLELHGPGTLEPARCVILAVPHAAYRDGGWALVRPLVEQGGGLVMDVRGVLPPEGCPPGVELWRL